MEYHYAAGLFTQKVAFGTNSDPLVLEANVVRMQDGGLFLSWTGDGSVEPTVQNRCYFSKSYDNGRTWEEKNVFFSHPRKGMFTPEIFTYKDKLFAFPCSYYNIDESSFAQDCHSYVSVSSDCGKTFSAPSSIGNAINNVHIKDHLVIGKRILLSCSWIECHGEGWAWFKGGSKDCIVAGKQYREEDFQGLSTTEYCGVMISDDDGNSWRLSGRLGVKDTHYVEPVLTSLSDGTIVMFIRREDVPYIFESRSKDNGESWSEAVNTGMPSSITKVAFAKDKKGRIYLLHNPKGKRNPLSLWVSDDDMKTWRVKVDLVSCDEKRKLAYPDAFIDEDRQMLCFGWDDRRNIYYSEYYIGDL